MYSISFALVTARLLTGVIATPIVDTIHQHERRQEVSTAQVEWKNPTGGNMQLGYADKGVQFGNMKPSDIINNNISVTCGTIGTCVGNNNVDVGKAQWINSGELDDLDISYTVSGDYPQWAHNGLIEMLAWAMDNQTQTNNACYSPYSECGSFESYCPEPQKSCQDQYTAPGSVAVVLAGNMVDADAAPGYISVQFTVKEEGDDGICSKLTTLGSGLASFIGDASGPVGGMFTLASLFCDS